MIHKYKIKTKTFLIFSHCQLSEIHKYHDNYTNAQQSKKRKILTSARSKASSFPSSAFSRIFSISTIIPPNFVKIYFDCSSWIKPSEFTFCDSTFSKTLSTTNKPCCTWPVIFSRSSLCLAPGVQDTYRCFRVKLWQFGKDKDETQYTVPLAREGNPAPPFR